MILLTSMIPKIATILKSILGLSSIIVIHEFGHFLFCKLFGVKTPVFSVGMGPALFQKKIGETTFQISSLPLGGYVEIYTDEENLSAKGNFNSLNYPKKMLILLGGIFFNLLSACLVFAAINFFAGEPTGILKSIVIEKVEDNSLCKNIIFKNDIIFGVNNIVFKQENIEPDEFRKEVLRSKGSTLELLIERKTEDSSRPNKIKIDLLIPNSDKEFGLLGLGLQPNIKTIFTKKMSLLDSILLAIKITAVKTIQVAQSFKAVFSKDALKCIAGPIMIIKESTKASEGGLINFLLFLCMFSISLAVMNVLPLGVLDGGRLFTVSLETLVGRPLNILTIIINGFSLILLLGLTIYLAIKELIQIFFT